MLKESNLFNEQISESDMNEILGGGKEYSVYTYTLVKTPCGDHNADVCFKRLTQIDTYESKLFGNDVLINTQSGLNDGFIGC